MTWLALTRGRRRVLELIDEAITSLERDVRALLTSERLRSSERIPLECAIFIYWSVHVGIVNAQTCALDRWLARRALDRELRRVSRPAGGGVGPMSELLVGYEQRRREVLATTRNIYLYAGRGADRPIVPVTQASAKLFLRKLGYGHILPHVAPRLAETLSTHFWSCARHFRPLIRTSFP